MLTALNLPPFEWDFRRSKDTLFLYDIIRKKYVQLTPEEWVRQHFLHFMLAEGYPKGRIQVEGALTYNTRTKRSDILAWSAARQPHLLVECKAPQVKLSETVWQQAKFYNQVHQAPYIALTNGLEHLYAKFEHGAYQPIHSLPSPR